MPAQIAMRHIERHQTAALEGIAQRDARQAANAEPRFHRAFDGLGVLKFQQDVEARQQPVQGAVEGLAGARARLAQDPGRREQIVVVEAIALGEYMVGRAKGDQLVLPPRGDDQFRMTQFALDQAQVQIEAGDAGGDMGGVVHRQRHANAGVLVHEIRHQADRQIVTDGQGGADVERAGIRTTGETRLQRLRLIQQGQRLGLQCPAQIVELQTLAGAVEEANIELPFQILERAAGGGLGHGQTLCRAADVLEAGGGEKDFELAQGVVHYRHTRLTICK